MRQRTLLATLLLAACSDTHPVGTQLLLSLRAAHARWESRGIDSYELTVRRVCYCAFVDPVRVRVVDGSIVSWTVVPTGEPAPAILAERIPDVPGLFAIVKEAAVEADDLDTRFDPVYGFPTEISIDWDEAAVDDEVVYLAEAFTPLAETTPVP